MQPRLLTGLLAAAGRQAGTERREIGKGEREIVAEGRHWEIRREGRKGERRVRNENFGR